MKKFFAFFVMIWKWFLSLFTRKDYGKLKKESDDSEQVQFSNAPVIPQHNNRRITKGRFVQYINVGENRQRAIYHGAK